MKQFFSHTPPSQKLLLLIIITLLSWFIISLAGTLLAFPIWGTEALTDTGQLLNNVAFLKYFQVLQSIALFIAPPIIFEYITSGQITLRHFREININSTLAIVAILLVIVAQPFISFLGVFNNGIVLPESWLHIEEWMKDKENAAMQATEIFLSAKGWSQTIINAIIIAVIPAIGEELMFRGSLQHLFNKILKNKHFSVILSALLFSAIHIQFFGFLPRFILGVLFGYLMVYGRNIWLPILAHFTNNFMAFILYQHYASNSTTNDNPLIVGNEYPQMIWVVLSIMGIITLLYLCLWFTKNRKGRNHASSTSQGS
ncbi:CPBP family intramembrane glutamic endopeptidase [Saccharicrinis fermentans]|uniref:CAAX amino terminal protease n=1 Tax=Saccharicrinis fermentans DSM 9555 = JCM 21142 TaxID=869213 RepID=W7YKD2_9BACT|nr:CPBP family intramembrane glutamic endopeptidase [Saccharicrinis fermentans]GAF02809.1 CAAX amino terminal protease [Saccharicrinis fermentans DSM 9555 = JCM 21142]